VDELIGKNMGPYTITERIGDGGMAIVYKAYQESLNRSVAIKVLRDELARDQQFVARFRQEALAAANLDHPNILTVYDAGSANGKYFIAMAYVDGGTLKDQIRQGAIDPERAVSIAIQLAEALDHAHRQGLIHRDVKPTNVLMTRDGRPLLTDFGIAKALFEARQLTRTGASIGTPEYMAPEQAQGQSPDGRTDIYALGVVLYEMLAARVPFCTDTPVATMYMHVHEPPPMLRQVQGNVPEWLENVVCKALAKNPDDRYSTAALFAAALRQGREEMRAAGRQPTPATDAPTRVGPTAASEWDAPTAMGPTAAAGARRTPPPATDATPARPLTPIPATGGTPAEAVVAEKRRRRPLVPILIGAIALLVIGVSVSAAFLLGGGSDATPAIVTVIVSPDTPTTEELGEAVDEVTGTPTATDEASATATNTLTPSVTPSGTTTTTATPSATPSSSATATPSRTPTATEAATATATPTSTTVPTDTPVPPTNTAVPPTPVPPTDTPPPTDPPPPPTNTLPPPTNTPPTEPPPP